MTASVRPRRLRSAVPAAGVVLMIAALAGIAYRWREAHLPARPYELWLYYATNLADPEAVERLESVWRRAASAGYRHVMLADPKFARLDQMDSTYHAHARQVKRLAAELGLELVPGVFLLGRSGSLLAHDPNLAEGLPVRDAPFEVRGGEARPVRDPALALGERWELRDPGVRLAGGVVTIRDPRRVARVMQPVRVHPFRCYHLSVEIRTRDFTGTPAVEVLAGGRPLLYEKTLGAQPTQEWTRHDVIFNSLAHSQVQVYLGSWRPARGSLEWRNWRIEESGPVNLLRRESAPFTVAGYVEGRDYEPIHDPRLGVAPWPGRFDAWHEPPALRTRLAEGTRLAVSWHHAAVVYGQVMCCPSEPAVQDLLAGEARRMRELWEAPGYLMMIDEIRVLNRDASCTRRAMAPGALLAEQARRCRELLPGAEVYVWSDMFDPHHNATRDYCLVDGDLAGSWEGLAPDVVIVNWNGTRPRQSLRFFAGRGHRQILAGYYDGRPEEMRGWLRAARGIEGVVGVMYTTWQERYDDLEAFAAVSRRDHRAPRAR